MKKIIVAFDGTNYSEACMRFVEFLHTQQSVMVTGIFLPLVDVSQLWTVHPEYAGSTVATSTEAGPANVISAHVARFEETCRKHFIRYKVHKDLFDFALPQLKKETRYADLLVIGSESFYKGLGSTAPNEHLQDVLRQSECPVMLVPDQFTEPTHNLLTYDGSESSVFAIRQFAYLFPEWNQVPTDIVYVSDDKEAVFPEEAQLRELAAWHFGNLSYTTLKIDPYKYFSTWASEKKGAVVVSGAFGRSGLSTMFRKSFAAELISDHRLLVFIAHK